MSRITPLRKKNTCSALCGVIEGGTIITDQIRLIIINRVRFSHGAPSYYAAGTHRTGEQRLRERPQLRLLPGQGRAVASHRGRWARPLGAESSLTVAGAAARGSGGHADSVVDICGEGKALILNGLASQNTSANDLT